jgi:zinc transporter 1/2/3
MSDQQPNCGPGGGADTWFGLRVASVFIVLAGSISGALFPVLIQNSTWLHVPKSVFEFVSFSFFKIIKMTIFIFLQFCEVFWFRRDRV